MNVFYLNNLATEQTKKEDFAKLIQNPPAVPLFQTKKEIIDWRENKHTKHVFFSPFEGITPHLRISQQSDGNQAWVMHGFVGDFDQKLVSDQSMLDSININATPDFPVGYATRTFSGQAHLVWEFEKPINIINPMMLDGFIKTFCSMARVRKVLGGFDEMSLRPSLYYTLYDQWHTLGGVVSENLLQHILYQVGRNIKTYQDEGPSLPWDVIEHQLNKKFPGRWTGKVEEGARGVRFWDPSATNQTAAMLTPTGVAYFTDGGGFLPWGSTALFGPDVVRAYEANTIGEAVKEVYYDGKHFYRRVNDNWLTDNMSVIQTNLSVQGGLSRKTTKTKEFSEVDQAINHITTNNRVEGALPFVFCKDSIVRREDGVYVNTAKAVPHRMSDNPVKWGEGFPFIADWLDNFFYTKFQKILWLSWLHRFYKNAYDGTPVPGQCMFIVGGRDSGKTLMNHRLLGPMMGGHTNIAKYVTGEDNFNENLFKCGLATVDDAIASTDRRAHTRYTTLLKMIVANRDLSMRAMHKGAVDITWCGRVSITMNEDPESLRMLPQLDVNNTDKLIILRAQKSAVDFPPDVEEIIRAELPCFCRFIYDFGIPRECRGGNRFGTIDYIDPLLRSEAEYSSATYAIVELLNEWRESYFTAHPDKSEWFGSITKLITELSAEFGETPQCMSGITPNTLAKQLITAMTRHGWIKRTKRKGTQGFTIFKQRDEEIGGESLPEVQYDDEPDVPDLERYDPDEDGFGDILEA